MEEMVLGYFAGEAMRDSEREGEREREREGRKQRTKKGKWRRGGICALVAAVGRGRRRRQAPFGPGAIGGLDDNDVAGKNERRDEEQTYDASD